MTWVCGFKRVRAYTRVHEASAPLSVQPRGDCHARAPEAIV